MASIRQRALEDGGGWQVRYSTPDGRAHSRTFTRAADARRFGSTVEADIIRGQWIDPALGQTTFAEFAESWADANLGRLKPTTRSGYESLLRAHLLPAFGAMPLQAIRRHDVEAFVTARLSDGLSASRIGQAYRLLGMILSSAVDNDFLAKSPAAGVRLPRSSAREQRFLSASEVARIVAEIPPEHEALVLVLAYCGLRWGEAVALRRERVNLLRRRLEVRESASEADGRLHFGPTKTYQARSVPLPSFLVDALARHLETGAAPEALVFTSARGGPLRGANWRRRVWHPVLERAELPPIRIHDLRHTCAALLILQGHSPKAIQSHLGHSSITVTLDTYGHLFPEEADRISESLDALYQGVPIATPSDRRA